MLVSNQVRLCVQMTSRANLFRANAIVHALRHGPVSDVGDVTDDRKTFSSVGVLMRLITAFN